ncbi:MULTISPECIES: hypothetical protein [Streptomyces]|uniref:Uncharacterized protein n=1 Tax=Streptomyces pratensis (strain ATCC 33331 / IAF-45CD) TaxID=591167 RepID=A0A8D3WDG2_STRFA|nr:hypothetical protein [Streptomyces sp. SID7815]MYT50118.1 hypothetical protein [Streptomyces sp. SID7815]
MTDPGDLLLRWVSERGAGTLSDVKQGMWWLASTYCPDIEPGAAGRWLRDAVSLGHIDIDWRNRRWSAAPPVLTRLPQARGLAVLAGSRTVAFDHRLDQAVRDGLVELFRVPSARPPRDIPLPVSLIVQFDDEAGLAQWATELGAEYTSCFALQGAALLPPLGLEVRTSAPEFGQPLEQYSLDRREYQPAVRPQGDGLYRLKQREGKRVCQVRHSGEWYQTSHEEGVYSVLESRNPEADVLRWLPEKDCGRERFGTLYVDWGYPLPDLHRRVAVMCSGLAPRINSHAENLAYDNVPKAVAIKIADSLGQHLGENDE